MKGSHATAKMLKLKVTCKLYNKYFGNVIANLLKGLKLNL